MASPPRGLSLLIVEANMILALDVEDMLLRNGAAKVKIVDTSDEALLLLRDTTSFDIALLDLNLPRSNTLPVAMRLAELGIPFAFSAAYGERAHLPEPFRKTALIRTPCNETYLLAALTRLLNLPRPS